MKPHVCILFLLATLIIFGGNTSMAQTVTTDQSDYTPGSTAIITGTGFASGETVQL